MTFVEMVDFLNKQKNTFEYVCRENWDKKFLMKIPKSTYLVIVSNSLGDNPPVTIYTPTIEDILSNDWVIKIFNYIK